MTRRATGTAALALLFGASSAWATMECADYISGGPNSPLSGQLVGEQLVTEEFGFGVDAGVHAGLKGTVEYRVGYYRLTTGKVIRVDCRDYSMA